MTYNDLMETARKQGIQRVVVIGGGVIEQRDGNFFIKAAMYHHLSNFTHYFSSVSFVAPLYRGPQLYTNAVEHEQIELIPWTFGPTGYELSFLKQLWLYVNRHSVVIFQVPQSTLLPVLPFLKLRAKRLIAYVAGDWVELAKELRQKDKGWRVPIDNLAAELSIRWANHVLVRGPKLFHQAQKLNPNVTLSLPIMSIDEIPPLRHDTCQQEQITLLYIGKLLVGKGLGTILDAMFLLRSHQPELGKRLRLDVLGTGQDEKLFRDQIANLGLEDSVHFWGYVDDPQRLSQAFVQADIQIVPSIESEGLPRVIDEGLCYGQPIISTNNGSIPHLYVDRQDLLIIPRGDALALAGSILEIINDTGLRLRLIQNSQRHREQLRQGRNAACQHTAIILDCLRSHSTGNLT